MQSRPYLPPGHGAPLARRDVIDLPAIDLSAESGGWLFEFWEIVRRRKLSVLVTTAVCTLAAFLVTLQMTPIYQARTVIEVQGLNEEFLNMRESNPTASTSRSETYLRNQIRLLQSTSLADRVVAQLALDELVEKRGEPGRLSRMFSLLGEWAGVPEPYDAPAKLRARGMVLNNLLIAPVHHSSIIEIYYEFPHAEMAAEVANTLVNEFIAYNAEARWKLADSTKQWLNRHVEELRDQLRKSEGELQSYAAASGLIFTSEQGGAETDKLRQVQTEVSRVQADRMTKQSRYELAASVPAESLPEVLNDTILRDYQVQLTALRQELAGLSTLLTPTNYKVQQVANQIKELEVVLEQERAKILDRLRNEYESAQRNEKLLLEAYNRQTQRVSEQAGKAINYDLLRGEVESNRQIYETVLQRGKEAGIVSAMRPETIRLVDRAEPPTQPVSPSLVINSALGLFTGLFSGTLLVFIRENADRSRQASDRRLKLPGDAFSCLDVPELAAIPSGYSDARQLGSGNGVSSGSRKRLLHLFNRREPSHGAGEGTCVELLAGSESPTPLSESYRAAVTSILFAREHGQRQDVIVITSPTSGEGKTTTTTNLGISLAQIRRRVLIVDGDLRRPRIHNIFGLDNSQGLAALLRGDGSSEDSRLHEFIHPTEIPNLHVLPAGSGGTNTLNLLYSPRMLALLWQFRQQFDTVLIDAPPVLPVVDARIMGKLADAVILVFRAGHTSPDLARKAKEYFDKDGTAILGTILNRYDPDPDDAESYYQHLYYDVPSEK